MSESLNKTFRYGTKEHRDILQALTSRKKFSADHMADRHGIWKKNEEEAKAYINLKDADRMRKSEKSQGKTEYVTLQVPYSYGLLMAAHTYWTSVFLARSPILQYSVRHGVSQGGGEQAIEALMDYQVNVGKMIVPWTHWLMDTPKYGVGWTGHYWANETVRTAKIVEEETVFGAFTTGKKKKVKRTVEIPGYQGNKLFNIRPQDAFPDPRKSLGNFQDGEFFARYVELDWLDLHEGALESTYMNIDVLKKKSDGKYYDPDRDTGSGNFEIPDANEFDTTNLGIPNTGIVEGFEIYVHLIPKLWKLGKGEKRELWVFVVAKGDIIISARPLGALHNEFPIDNMEYEVDAHTMFKRSMLETVEPLNDALTWMLNSHFFAVRKALNNQFIYDPMKIRGSDLTDPEQGLMIRLKPDAYGTPINQSFQQLQVTDVTKTHMSDMKVLMEMMQRVTGVNDIIMGMMSASGRQTATEVRGASGGSANRLKSQAEYMSAQGFSPQSQRMLQTTQQHLDVERRYRIAGDLLPGGVQDMQVGPEQIAGFYDFVPVDGSLPIDKFAQANLWREIMAQMAQIEPIAQQYDIGKIFAYTAQLAGAKNVQRFKIQLQPDDQIARDAAAGNIIPLGGTYDAADGSGQNPSRRITGDAQAGNPRLVEPPQIPGLGALS